MLVTGLHTPSFAERIDKTCFPSVTRFHLGLLRKSRRNPLFRNRESQPQSSPDQVYIIQILENRFLNSANSAPDIMLKGRETLSI